MDILKKLFAPLKYINIRHPQKRLIEMWLPFWLAAALSLIYYLLPVKFSITGTEGLLANTKGFVQFLTGFYVAALAAIATFNNNNMDIATDGEGLTLDSVYLTRRQFLSYLFGYLALLGMCLVSIPILVQLIKPSLLYINLSWFSVLIELLRYVFLFTYSFYLFRLLLTTLFGLYYLTEKVHQQKSEFVEPSAAEDEEF